MEFGTKQQATEFNLKQEDTCFRCRNVYPELRLFMHHNEKLCGQCYQAAVKAQDEKRLGIKLPKNY
jgi:Zn finger protein HypA/HybF involved in hydrogenase expression